MPLNLSRQFTLGIDRILNTPSKLASLSDWEQSFVNSIEKQLSAKKELSVKQSDLLLKMLKKHQVLDVPKPHVVRLTLPG
jgi:hypothetical protein